MPSKTGFTGVYPMLYAFFGADGRLDRAAIRRQIDGCLAAGAHGLAILGIASEMNKLSGHERRQFLDWVAEDTNGRVPLAVTVPEPNVPDQIAFARAAHAAGANWVILQPPPVKGVAAAELVRFFGEVAEHCELPVAIQNNTVNLDVWLPNDALASLARQHPNITLLKGEGPLLAVHRMIEELGDAFDVFSGLVSKETINLLRAGCVGIIPSAESIDVHVRIFELMQTGDPGDEAQAAALDRDILPLVTFVHASVENYLCYGKRLMARRLGLETFHPRPPAVHPTPFGDAVLARYAAGLGPLGKDT